MVGINFRVDALSFSEIENIVINYLNEYIPNSVLEKQTLDVEKLLDVIIFRSHRFRKRINDDMLEGFKALTHPFSKIIEIGQKTQNLLEMEDPWTRFYICHEIFHVVAHVHQVMSFNVKNVQLIQSFPYSFIPIEYHPEFQADVGSMIMLIPTNPALDAYEKLKKKGINELEIAKRFANFYLVPFKVAMIRLYTLIYKEIPFDILNCPCYGIDSKLH